MDELVLPPLLSYYVLDVGAERGVVGPCRIVSAPGEVHVCNKSCLSVLGVVASEQLKNRNHPTLSLFCVCGSLAATDRLCQPVSACLLLLRTHTHKMGLVAIMP